MFVDSVNITTATSLCRNYRTKLSRCCEPVESILNFLRLRTDQRLIVSPARRLTRGYVADVNDKHRDIGGDWSMEVNTNLDIFSTSVDDTVHCP